MAQYKIKTGKKSKKAAPDVKGGAKGNAPMKRKGTKGQIDALLSSIKRKGSTKLKGFGR